MRYGTGGDDFTERVWEKGLIGIWFGSWDIEDLYSAYEAYRPKKNHEVTNLEVEQHINDLLKGRGLPQNMNAAFVPTIKKFDQLTENTWVFTYFEGRLHFGQVAGVDPKNEPQFDCNQEHFKAKPIKNRKSFVVAKLPDAFRLLASAGQQTLHRLGESYEKLASILIEAKDADDVLSAIRGLSLPEWMDALGPKGWESICTAYLILEYGFLPTGLLIGGTLADFDIVGHDLNGTAIYGQCKKRPTPYPFSENDEQSFAGLPKDAKKFFFPYAGPDESPLFGVSIVSYNRIREWFETTEHGRRYERVLRLGGS